MSSYGFRIHNAFASIIRKRMLVVVVWEAKIGKPLIFECGIELLRLFVGFWYSCKHNWHYKSLKAVSVRVGILLQSFFQATSWIHSRVNLNFFAKSIDSEIVVSVPYIMSLGRMTFFPNIISHGEKLVEQCVTIL